MDRFFYQGNIILRNEYIPSVMLYMEFMPQRRLTEKQERIPFLKIYTVLCPHQSMSLTTIRVIFSHHKITFSRLNLSQLPSCRRSTHCDTTNSFPNYQMIWSPSVQPTIGCLRSLRLWIHTIAQPISLQLN